MPLVAIQNFRKTLGEIIEMLEFEPWPLHEMRRERRRSPRTGPEVDRKQIELPFVRPVAMRRPRSVADRRMMRSTDRGR